MTGDGHSAQKRAAGSVKWADLGRRFGSAVVLVILATILILSSGLWLRFGISIVAGLLMWELARLTGWRHPEYHSPRHPELIGFLGGLTALAMLTLPGDWPMALVLVPVLAGLPGTNRHERVAYVAFTIAMLVAPYAFVVIHEVMGLPTILWIVGTVILSDVLGYFVGRRLGGPRFWPAISPKKTWSGTIAGWVGAVLLALALWATGLAGWGVLIAGPLLAVAGQFGDIAESWLKRRVDVKDSSNLIPGHGGVMDRFDAMSGALLAALIMMIAGLLPVIGG
ncbi:phosphatidate cytidylyltransferase [Paracoccus sulfuroxidans]|uniref:Phosphatidate cytidylyltransferase n=1 Tax=Paracoccus sulfuroxidans TaxID=384678 RepID=A0A562NKU5_9RHOB|nr:phosphatidate cytidylyltransferase [Paracoccus sulfuroxidans]TWI32794.1 phosphatidate cytidylyltransferase [Paracoccus sulfuroxidans]